jgi:hypothetical protein
MCAGYGIRDDSMRQDPAHIVRRFFEHYGDDFDFVAMFTSFEDQGSPGALAYEESTQIDVQGLGLSPFNDNATWGAKGTRFHAFLNMKTFADYESYGPITDPSNFLYPVWGQESAHRWLAFMRFKKSDGSMSMGMLGRDNAHWSALLQSDASVMDGVKYEPQPNGLFKIVEKFARYSPLDQYAMGLRDAGEVPPFFVIENGTNAATHATIPVYPAPAKGTLVAGNRVDITIDDIIAANGPRMPAPADAPKAFRMAVVLVTQPGQTLEDVAPMADTLEQVRKLWEQAFSDQTGGRGQMCTQITVPCDAPTARVGGGEVKELKGNGDGSVGPGEVASIKVQLKNDGVGKAGGVMVTLTTDTQGVMLSTPMVMVGDIDQGKTATATFQAMLGSQIVCGQAINFHAEATVGGHKFTGVFAYVPGMIDKVVEDFETDEGWKVNPDGKDTATSGAWEIGMPEQTTINGVTMQPGAAATGRGVMITGAAAMTHAQDNDVDGGFTTVQSPKYDLHTIKTPMLRYQAWHMALDFNNGSTTPVPTTGDDLVVQASDDDGKTWKEVDRISAPTYGWAQRMVALPLQPTPTVRLRFIAQDGGPKQNLVEAAIDDVHIESAAPSCFRTTTGGPGAAMNADAGGCDAVPGRGHVHGSELGSAAVLLLAVGLLAARRRAW